jgi:hypothetical protein
LKAERETRKKKKKKKKKEKRYPVQQVAKQESRRNTLYEAQSLTRKVLQITVVGLVFFLAIFTLGD